MDGLVPKFRGPPGHTATTDPIAPNVDPRAGRKREETDGLHRKCAESISSALLWACRTGRPAEGRYCRWEKSHHPQRIKSCEYCSWMHTFDSKALTYASFQLGKVTLESDQCLGHFRAVSSCPIRAWVWREAPSTKDDPIIIQPMQENTPRGRGGPPLA